MPCSPSRSLIDLLGLREFMIIPNEKWQTVSFQFQFPLSNSGCFRSHFLPWRVCSLPEHIAIDPPNAGCAVEQESLTRSSHLRPLGSQRRCNYAGSFLSLEVHYIG